MEGVLGLVLGAVSGGFSCVRGHLMGVLWESYVVLGGLSGGAFGRALRLF